MRQVANSDVLRLQHLSKLIKSNWEQIFTFLLPSMMSAMKSTLQYLYGGRYKCPSWVRILYSSPLVLALSPTSRRFIDTFSIILDYKVIAKNKQLMINKCQNLNSKLERRRPDQKSESIQEFGRLMI